MQPTIDTFHTHLRTHALPHLRDAQAAEYGAAVVLLAMLDLEPARPILERNCSPRRWLPRRLNKTRGQTLRDPHEFDAWGSKRS